MTRYTLREIKDGTGFEPGARFEQVQDYNGWTNRETWAVALHINNDQGWQESVHYALRAESERRGELGEVHGAENVEPLSNWQAGDIIRENVEEFLDAPDSGVDAAIALGILRDIGSLYRVDWDELGAAFLDDIKDA